MVVCKLYGIVDISVAAILILMDIPYIGPLKWLFVLILLIKGIPSLWG